MRWFNRTGFAICSTLVVTACANNGNDNVPDARLTMVDAALVVIDGHTIVADAAGNHLDAHVVQPDAANHVADAATSAPDAATSAADATSSDSDAAGDASIDAAPDASVDAIVNPFAGGDGSPGNPFQIATLAQLIDVNDATFSTFSFKLMIDVDLTDVAMQPIGFQNDNQVFVFSGSFDGNHHTISNWTYTSGNGCVGLFATLGGQVSDLTLSSPTVSGTSTASVGALVGCNNGVVIRDSVIAGQVTSDYYGGGLVGQQSVSGTITGIANSSSSAAVTSPFAGGLIGFSNGQIIDSYASGEVTPTTFGGASLIGYGSQTDMLRTYASGLVNSSSGTLGALVAFDNGGITAVDSFWDVDDTGQASSSYGAPLSAQQMTDASNFTDWNFVDVWNIVAEQAPTLQANGNVAPLTMSTELYMSEPVAFPFTIPAYDFNGDALSYAILSAPARGTLSSVVDGQISYTPDGWNGYQDSMTFQVTDSHGLTSPISTITFSVQGECNPAETGFTHGGDGSSDNPYVVTTVAELQLVHLYSLCSFVVGADIDLTGISFAPIGPNVSPFSATFDGGNHKISNWSYTSVDPNEIIGFFGNTAGAVVENLQLLNVNVNGAFTTAGAIGVAEGSVTNVSVTGTVTSSSGYAGGLIGYSESTVTSCSAAVTVTGASPQDNGYGAGGLIAWHINGHVSKSHATGDVQGANAGGLIGGDQDASVDESFATGDVISLSTYGGGLIGTFDGDGHHVNDSFATGSVNGQDVTGGFIGLLDFGGSPTDTIALSRDYSLGEVTSLTANIGGFIGLDKNPPTNTITNCFWDTTTSHLATTSDTTSLGETDAAMKLQATYTNWDFTTVWTIASGGYPTLR